jgi:hypothetical protein
LVVFNNSITNLVGGVDIGGKTLHVSWIIQLLVDQKVKSLVARVTFSFVNFVSDLFGPFGFFLGHGLHFDVELRNRLDVNLFVWGVDKITDGFSRDVILLHEVKLVIFPVIEGGSRGLCQESQDCKRNVFHFL